jgi:tRNA (guanine-N7-)-methyltransferase
MRMRKKKHAEDRLEVCKEYIYSHRGDPLVNPSADVFSKESRVFLEIGAGKGGFACGMAKNNPNAAYFAMEKVTDCVVLAAEKAMETKDDRDDNLRFVVDTADNLLKIFAPGTVDAIFLNFSDPWPKKGHAKRRLTHRRYLALYMNLLRDGGILRLKTDNVGLFDFSLEEIEAVGLTLDKMTRDLHSSEWCEGNVMTEYETAFSSKGVAINMLELHKPEGFTHEVDPEFYDREFYKKR